MEGSESSVVGFARIGIISLKRRIFGNAFSQAMYIGAQIQAGRMDCIVCRRTLDRMSITVCKKDTLLLLLRVRGSTRNPFLIFKRERLPTE
jgi:hypothetical protein